MKLNIAAASFALTLTDNNDAPLMSTSMENYTFSVDVEKLIATVVGLVAATESQVFSATAPRTEVKDPEVETSADAEQREKPRDAEPKVRAVDKDGNVTEITSFEQLLDMMVSGDETVDWQCNCGNCAERRRAAH